MGRFLREAMPLLWFLLNIFYLASLSIGTPSLPLPGLGSCRSPSLAALFLFSSSWILPSFKIPLSPPILPQDFPNSSLHRSYPPMKAHGTACTSHPLCLLESKHRRWLELTGGLRGRGQDGNSELRESDLSQLAKHGTSILQLYSFGNPNLGNI